MVSTPARGDQHMGRRLTHKKVDILCVRMPFELQRELIQIPDPDLRFVRSSRDDMVSVPGRFYAVASLGEFEVLDEL